MEEQFVTMDEFCAKSTEFLNNNPGLTLHQALEMTTAWMKNNGRELTFSTAQDVDEFYFGGYGNCWWAAYAFDPVGSRFNLEQESEDGVEAFNCEIVATFGLTCQCALTRVE